MPIKVGVIGTGYLGQHHARIYSEIPDAELVAIADIDEEKAKGFAEKYSCKACSDYKEIIDRVDALSIVTPTVYHHKIAMECLSAGKDLLIEKPITKTVEEADELLSIAKDKGLILQVGHVERFNAGFLAAAKVIDNPLFIECHRLGPYKQRSTDIGVVLSWVIPNSSPTRPVTSLTVHIL